jgi:hypothetical protein
MTFNPEKFAQEIGFTQVPLATVALVLTRVLRTQRTKLREVRQALLVNEKAADWAGFDERESLAFQVINHSPSR